MADTTFVDFATKIVSAWLNDLNIVAYRGLGAAGVVPATPVTVQANLGIKSVTDSGAVNALVLTYPSNLLTYTDGLSLAFKVAVTNTGATTANVNGLGVKNILKPDGSALIAGDLVAGRIYHVFYNSTLGGGAFQLDVFPPNNLYLSTARNSASRTTAGVFDTFTALLNPSSSFVAATGIYTAKSAGIYLVMIAGAVTFIGTNASAVFEVRINSVAQPGGVTAQATFATNSSTATLVQPFQLAVNDTVTSALSSIAGTSTTAVALLFSVMKLPG